MRAPTKANSCELVAALARGGVARPSVHVVMAWLS